MRKSWLNLDREGGASSEVDFDVWLDTTGLIMAGSCTGDALRDEGAMMSSEQGRARVTFGVRRDHFKAYIVAGWSGGRGRGRKIPGPFPSVRFLLKTQWVRF